MQHARITSLDYPDAKDTSSFKEIDLTIVELCQTTRSMTSNIRKLSHLGGIKLDGQILVEQALVLELLDEKTKNLSLASKIAVYEKAGWKYEPTAAEVAADKKR